jgi:hypothetical protein
MDLSSTSSKNVPKMSSPTLVIKDNYYLVRIRGVYNYYPIKVQAFTPEDNIIRFEKAPPVLMEGIAIVGKKPYKVTPEDLMRQIIRKSREVAVPKRETKVNGKSESPGIEAVPTPVQRKDERGTSGEAPMEVEQAADNAWSEQIGALLDLISEKEGIEVEIQDAA